MKYTKLYLKEFRQEKALAMLFTPRQRKIIEEIITMQKLSKVDNEVYSRTIKPRLNAIIDVYEIAIIARAKD